VNPDTILFVCLLNCFKPEHILLRRPICWPIRILSDCLVFTFVHTVSHLNKGFEFSKERGHIHRYEYTILYNYSSTCKVYRKASQDAYVAAEMLIESSHKRLKPGKIKVS